MLLLSTYSKDAVTGAVNGVTNPTFGYDANGTMISGAGRTITTTTFNMAASIASGANTVWFGYDPDHARYKMVSSGVNAGTTYYLNDAASGAMEEKEVVAGVTTWRDYLMADGKLLGERMCTGPPPCSSGASMLYFILDHLGSVSVVTDGSGNVLQRLSYDAWGQRRNADGSALACGGGMTSPNGVSRGFTGQEMIDALCLVNLNARIYDPALGRFMAADPIVADSTIPQELNRYSYVLNDPLSLTDPSGLCFLGCFWKSAIFREFAALAFAIVTQQYELLPQLEGLAAADVGLTLTVVNAGIIGGISGAISTGTFKGAALGALEGGLFAEVGNVLKAQALTNGAFGLGRTPTVFIAHGLVGGLLSEVEGGNFGSGFLAAGIATLAPTPFKGQPLSRTLEGTAESAVLGGVGSVLGGGKFQNGAATGAFGYLFNAAAHAAPKPQNPLALADELDDYIADHAPESPLVGEGQVIVADGIQWGVDPRFLVGIADAETTLGINITSGANNVFNNLYKGSNSPFDSLDSAIESEAKMIGRPGGYYFGQGLYDTSSFYAKYCSGADCGNGLRNINATLKNLGGNPNNTRYAGH